MTAAVLLAATSADGGAALVELGAVLVVVAGLARVAARFGLSPIPLYLLAGLCLGPGSPFPLEASDDFIEVAATLGVVLLLFFLGLEYTPRELIGNVRSALPAGLADTLNFLPGFAAALLLGWSVVAAVVLGGVTYVSSSGVIAKLLRDLGRLGNRESPTILSVLVIEDLVMAVYLPVLAGLVAGGAAIAVGVSVGIGVALVVAVILLAARFGDRLSAVLFTRSDEVVLFSILGLVFLVAGLAERVGVSAGVGAFLVGIALSGPLQHRAETLVAPLRDLFAAAFFIFFTFQIQPASLVSTFGAAIALAVVSGGLKAMTGWWAARRAGFATSSRVRVGLTLVARGEFSIVIAGIAVANGVDPELGALTATYVLVLAITGPVLARFSAPITNVVARRRRSAPATSAPTSGRTSAAGADEPPQSR